MMRQSSKIFLTLLTLAGTTYSDESNHISIKFDTEFQCWDIPCQLTPFLAFFCQTSPILLKFGMFLGVDRKMSQTKFQVSKSNSF